MEEEKPMKTHAELALLLVERQTAQNAKNAYLDGWLSTDSAGLSAPSHSADSLAKYAHVEAAYESSDRTFRAAMGRL